MMKRIALAALLFASAPAMAQICIVQKDGCQDISSGKVYEQQGSAYVDPETREVKIAPPKDYQTAYPENPRKERPGGTTRVKIRLEKKP